MRESDPIQAAGVYHTPAEQVKSSFAAVSVSRPQTHSLRSRGFPFGKSYSRCWRLVREL